MEADISDKIRPEFMSITGTNSLSTHNSASRSLMYASHLSQCLVLNESEEKIIQSGLEVELGKFTFSKKFDQQARVIDVVARYRNGIDKQSVDHVVDAVVIYENLDSDKPIYDVLNIPSISDNHQYFGFEYDWKHSVIKKLVPDAVIPAGTIVADSPNVKNNGGYGFGVNANVAMMTINDVTEDAMVISESFAKRTGFKIFERRIVEFGEESFLINLYGDENNYKPFPEIGEYIHESGAICVKRKKSDMMAPALMGVYDMMEFNPVFDESVFVRNKYGKVKDIKIYRSNKPKQRPISKTSELTDKYANAYIDYCKEIIDVYEKIKKEHKSRYRNDEVMLSPELTRIITEASIIVASDGNVRPPIHKMFRKEDMDMYRAEFVIEYDLVPGVGYKNTDSHGGKAVICHVRKDEDMPVDKNGVRADIITDPASTVSRMNIGRLYEGYMAAAARVAKNTICDEILALSDSDDESASNLLKVIDKNSVTKIFATAVEFLAHFNNQLYHAYQSITDPEYQRSLLHDIITTEFFVLYQVGDEKASYSVVDSLSQSRFAPFVDTVSFVENGVRKTTKEKIIIAPLYIMGLAKIADTWLSTSSARLNHFGMPSNAPKTAKHQFPWRNSAVRVLGETEARMYGSYVGEKFLAELKAAGSSPRTHKAMYRGILESENPTNIEKLVDREEVPFGDDKALEYIEAIYMCSGFALRYTPDKSRFHAVLARHLETVINDDDGEIEENDEND